MKISLLQKPTLFIISGLTLILISAGYRIYELRVLSFFGSEVINNQIPEVTENLPIAVRIDAEKINLKVTESIIIDGVWQIPPDGAGHLNTSSGIGSGNMVIYAHNNNNLFGPIRWIKKGGQIEITGQDKNIYRYQVMETKEVSPNEIEYVLPKKEEILTLYTCTGLFDSKRFIVLAKKI